MPVVGIDIDERYPDYSICHPSETYRALVRLTPRELIQIRRAGRLYERAQRLIESKLRCTETVGDTGP